MLMRVLTTGRVVLVAALVSASTAATLVLPAFAGAVAPAAGHAKDSAPTALVHAGSTPAVAVAVAASGVALGPAVKYVREADGTIRRVR
jgi:hypothetical protein